MCVYEVCMHVHVNEVCVYEMYMFDACREIACYAQVWRSEDKSVALPLSFHLYVGLGY